MVKNLNKDPFLVPMPAAINFWQAKTLDEMTPQEWEILCDGCGKCCLHKIEDEDSERIYFTNVACRLLDMTNCKCLDYEHRSDVVKDCLPLTSVMVHNVKWLPKSCAYRRLAEGRGLAWWHPLISGNQESVRRAGISVCGRVVPEASVDMSALEENVVDWLD